MTNSQSDAFEQLDREKRQEELNQIKQEAVQEAQKALIDRLQGSKKTFAWEEKGKKAPGDYNELFEEVDRRTVKKDDVSEIVRRELEQERKAEQERRAREDEESRKKQIDEIENNRKRFDAEWYDLVQQGKMPKVAEELQEKINKGEKLTKEEITSDEGLKARLELAQVSQQARKSAKLAYYEDYNKDPVGASAPVLGGRPSTPQVESGDDDYSYDEIRAQRKKMFGF